MLDKVYPKPLVRVFRLLFYILKIVFGCVILVQSIKLVIFNRRVFMTGVHVSQAWVSLAGVFMGSIMIFYLVCRIKKEVLNK